MAEKKLDARTQKLLEQAGELVIDGQLVKAPESAPEKDKPAKHEDKDGDTNG